jgi:lysophospholipid acyltransferase (LPLAT)-like uncharacterized protein
VLAIQKAHCLAGIQFEFTGSWSITNIHVATQHRGTRRPHKTRSQRQLTSTRWFVYRLATLIGAGIVELLWRTCRVKVIGGERLDTAIKNHPAIVYVCWHQHLLMCSRYLIEKRAAGIKLGFLISPSVDGEATAMLARRYGSHVVRGSSTYTGVQAVRHICKAVSAGISPLITPDGPRGPRFVFKGGALYMSQVCRVPVVTLAFAAKPAWVLKSWDKFALPLPFARVVITVGEPQVVPLDLSAPQMLRLQDEMAVQMHTAFQQARVALPSAAY